MADITDWQDQDAYPVADQLMISGRDADGDLANYQLQDSRTIVSTHTRLHGTWPYAFEPAPADLGILPRALWLYINALISQELMIGWGDLIASQTGVTGEGTVTIVQDHPDDDPDIAYQMFLEP